MAVIQFFSGSLNSEVKINLLKKKRILKILKFKKKKK
jgi:hypothetical protein